MAAFLSDIPHDPAGPQPEGSPQPVQPLPGGPAEPVTPILPDADPEPETEPA